MLFIYLFIYFLDIFKCQGICQFYIWTETDSPFEILLRPPIYSHFYLPLQNLTLSNISKPHIKQIKPWDFILTLADGLHTVQVGLNWNDCAIPYIKKNNLQKCLFSLHFFFKFKKRILLKNQVKGRSCSAFLKIPQASESIRLFPVKLSSDLRQFPFTKQMMNSLRAYCHAVQCKLHSGEAQKLTITVFVLQTTCLDLELLIIFQTFSHLHSNAGSSTKDEDINFIKT